MGYEDSQGSQYINPTAVQGYVAALAANAAATTGGVDYSFGWQNAAATQIAVNHVYVENNTTVNVLWELDAATNAGSPIIKPGDARMFDIRVTVLHLQTASPVNVNGNTAGNIVVKGWL